LRTAGKANRSSRIEGQKTEVLLEDGFFGVGWVVADIETRVCELADEAEAVGVGFSGQLRYSSTKQRGSVRVATKLDVVAADDKTFARRPALGRRVRGDVFTLGAK
jgi:hypothetical protein